MVNKYKNTGKKEDYETTLARENERKKWDDGKKRKKNTESGRGRTKERVI